MAKASTVPAPLIVMMGPPVKITSGAPLGVGLTTVPFAAIVVVLVVLGDVVAKGGDDGDGVAIDVAAASPEHDATIMLQPTRAATNR